MQIEISRVPFGVDPDSQQLVNLYNFYSHDQQLIASVSDFGATIVAFHTAEPQMPGDPSTDVVLGHKDFVKLAQSSNSTYYGATVGRCCGRIPQGRATMPDGSVDCTVTQNEGDNHLHGGRRGFSSRVWDASVLSEDTATEFVDAWWWQGAKDKALYSTAPVLVLELFSPDGEEGYPCNLNVAALFTVERRHTGDTWVSSLTIEYRAKLDPSEVRPTLVNLTNHTYFNLDPSLYGGVSDGGECHQVPTVPDTHTLQLHANQYLPATTALLHTGEITHVSTDPAFDFTTPKLISQDIDATIPQIAVARGYDHTFFLDKETTATGLRPCAQLTHNSSNRQLNVSTTQPAVHFYSGNFIKPDRIQIAFTDSVQFVALQPRSGVCFETQRINSHLPTIVLPPGGLYRETTRFELQSTSIHHPDISKNNPSKSEFVTA